MKVAIIGLGFMGGMHAQIYTALPGVELVAVADSNVERTQSKITEMKLTAEVFPDLESLLEGIEVDVIDICVPTDEHAKIAIKAAQAGKNLFIEKPLSLTIANCEAIQTAITEAGVYAQVGQCIRFWPEYVALKEFIESGKGGKLKSLSLQRRASRPTYSQDDWLNDEARSGGGAVDLHIHDTDFVIHLLGLPKSVYSRTTQGRSGPDHIFTSYQYDEVAVQTEGGWDYPEQYGLCMAFEAVFENASVAFNSASGAPLTLTLKDQKSTEMTVEQPGPKESTTGEGNISSLGGYFNELEYFTNCLKANKAPEIATVRQASDSLRVVLAELKSAQTETSVTL